MASEQRLINANALLERMNVVTADDTCPLHIAAEIDQEIALAPTVDAVEVVHGRWIEYQIPHIMCCSECDWGTGVQSDFRYCPSCGAKMDGNSDVPREN
jgi:hypothetical protein